MLCTVVIAVCLLGAYLTWHPFELVPPSAQARFGVCVSPRYGVMEEFEIDELNIGWYHDYRFQARPARPGGADYVQMVWGYPSDWMQLAVTVLLNRSSLWLVGNEPDNRYQGTRAPDEYARLYHDVYRFIKRFDISALVAIGGVSQPTPLRLQWLDEVLLAYEMTYGAPMPVDV
jgi:hypothetical protein